MDILSALTESGQRLTVSQDLLAQTEEVVRTCVEVFGVRLAWLGAAEADGSVTLLSQHPKDIPYPQKITVRWDQTPEGKGPTGRALRSGLPMVIKDISRDRRYAPWREAALEEGFCTSAAFPLISRGHTFGSLNLHSDQPGFFNQERVALLGAFARQAAAALANEQLYAENALRLSRITALRNIDRAIAGSLDLRVTYQVALDEIVSQLAIDAASILRFNQHTRDLEYAASRGFRTHAIEKSSVPLGDGTAGTAARERKVIHVADLSMVGDGFTRGELLKGEGFISYYGAPMVAKGKLLGVLEIFHRSPHSENSEWDGFLATLAGQVAIAIENASLFDELRDKHTELVVAYDDTVAGWGSALSLKEEETAEHSQRVTELTTKTAKAMGVKSERLVHIRRGALLHDIGKIGVPDSILLKPGKLTDQEWVVMRRHPVFAFEMLAPIEYLRAAIDIPYCHHERWDGSGYPRGLKGKQIPLAARIFAVVDVWDALTSDRPYRKAWEEEDTLAHIHERRGTHFDPEVVAHFWEVLREE